MSSRVQEYVCAKQLNTLQDKVSVKRHMKYWDSELKFYRITQVYKKCSEAPPLQCSYISEHFTNFEQRLLAKTNNYLCFSILWVFNDATNEDDNKVNKLHFDHWSASADNAFSDHWSAPKILNNTKKVAFQNPQYYFIYLQSKLTCIILLRW